ncbi:helix-turn-helix domain-containing protein [Streptomyces ipomoeae]|uniref:Helix-turn-helix domain-containing protein n=1 Tax=Streptomyces ipomoeae TaxID=103232 RepID=A0AAE8W5Q4_9ACTN|nr:helix-turn-helix domain-containing protein [Streptomyces ipomoeae]MDX2823580.1 helix-turn-helix domain-containing protein [Streptomyces ipomoeae]MDX2876112.1 helix-turn-helix domain-containing protein [Streptomyces ipomoeae]TQE35111.1 helix-turn-helix domain-containing protein [Streptomyces ipomoeae]
MTTGTTARGSSRTTIHAGPLVSARAQGTDWRDTLSHALGGVDISSQDPSSSGSVSTAVLGMLRVVRSEGDGMTVRRSAVSTEDTGRGDCVVVSLLESGAGRIDQDGRTAALETNDVFLYDTFRRVRLDITHSFRVKSLVLPRAALRSHEDDLCRITAVPFGPDTSIGALLPSVVTRLVDDAELFSADIGELMARNAVDLLGVLADEWLRRGRAEAADANRALLLRIQGFIDEQLADPELSPARIARAHHISLRYLHKLFQAEGTTVGRWILRRRLEACRRDLRHRQTRGLTIAAVAHLHGFASAAHFSRSFRAFYGVSPSEWRATLAPGSGVTYPPG